VTGDDEEMQRFVAIEDLFKGRHFDRQIIVLCVSWYTSFKLSLRDLVIHSQRGRSTIVYLTTEGDGYLPVLVITAQPSHKLRALEAGAKDFVSKPFDMNAVHRPNIFSGQRLHQHRTHPARSSPTERPA